MTGASALVYYATTGCPSSGSGCTQLAFWAYTGDLSPSTLLTYEQYVWVIDQVWGQDVWILAKFFFCVFMDQDEVEVHKLEKKERGQY